MRFCTEVIVFNVEQKTIPILFKIFPFPRMGGPLGLNNIVHFSLQLTIRCKYFEEMQELGE
jgi:hypothetical protein